MRTTLIKSIQTQAAPFTFSAKEKDAETGFSVTSLRSVWLKEPIIPDLCMNMISDKFN